MNRFYHRERDFGGKNPAWTSTRTSRWQKCLRGFVLNQRTRIREHERVSLSQNTDVTRVEQGILGEISVANVVECPSHYRTMNVRKWRASDCEERFVTVIVSLCVVAFSYPERKCSGEDCGRTRDAIVTEVDSRCSPSTVADREHGESAGARLGGPVERR